MIRARALLWPAVALAALGIATVASAALKPRRRPHADAVTVVVTPRGYSPNVPQPTP